MKVLILLEVRLLSTYTCLFWEIRLSAIERFVCRLNKVFRFYIYVFFTFKCLNEYTRDVKRVCHKGKNTFPEIKGTPAGNIKNSIPSYLYNYQALHEWHFAPIFISPRLLCTHTSDRSRPHKSLIAATTRTYSRWLLLSEQTVVYDPFCSGHSTGFQESTLGSDAGFSPCILTFETDRVQFRRYEVWDIRTTGRGVHKDCTYLFNTTTDLILATETMRH